MVLAHSHAHYTFSPRLPRPRYQRPGQRSRWPGRRSNLSRDLLHSLFRTLSYVSVHSFLFPIQYMYYLFFLSFFFYFTRRCRGIYTRIDAIAKTSRIQWRTNGWPNSSPLVVRSSHFTHDKEFYHLAGEPSQFDQWCPTEVIHNLSSRDERILRKHDFWGVHSWKNLK